MDVDIINQRQLDKLEGESMYYRAVDSHPHLAGLLDSNCASSRELLLKVGAQVILNKNVDVSKGLVNGARGVVLGFVPRQSGDPTSLFPLVKFVSGLKLIVTHEKWTIRSGNQLVTRRQLPLSLAWALSIHKSQGMSLDAVVISLSRAFEAGQAYVALSRARSLKGLKVSDLSPAAIRADPVVLKYYRSLMSY